jgi:uncharacterized protein (DUF1501 family)
VEHRTRTSRRNFLHIGAGTAAAFGFSQLASRPLFGAPANRTVVCLYLLGGNDSNNLIVPLDSPAYDTYARGRGPLALSRDTLLPVDGGNPRARYGFHPSLPRLRELYQQNALAVVANVGRVAAGHKIAGDGSDYERELQASYLADGHLGIPWATADSAPARTLTLKHGVSVASADAQPQRRQAILDRITADQAAPLTDTLVGRQLGAVLSALRSGAAGRAAFMVPVGGSSGGRNQLDAQAGLFAQLDAALTAFYRALADFRVPGDVVVYTDTEFNRTLAPNANGGTDHAWGGHQLVLGRPVLGGEIYGRFPSLEVGGPDDAAGNGTWAPSTTSAQYISTLASWYGIADLSAAPEFAAPAGSRLGFLPG